MRRLIIIATTAVLLLSALAGIAAATDVGWTGEVTGDVVAEDPYPGLAIDLSIKARPTTKSFVQAHGWGHYAYDGNAFRLRVTRACVTESESTVTAWGIARVTSGSFQSGTLTRGDKAYGILSLLDNGDGTVSARAGIGTDWEATIPGFVAVNCEHSPPDLVAPFPATGPGELAFMEK